MDSAEPSGGTLLAPPVVLVAVLVTVTELEAAVLDAVVFDVVGFVVAVFVVPPLVEPLLAVLSSEPPESSLQPEARPRSKAATREACMTWSKRMAGSIRRRAAFFKAIE